MRYFHSKHAFSLIEVTLALSVLAFSMLTLLALIPVGLNSTSDSLRKAEAANIFTQIEDDLRSTPLTSTSSPYFGITLTSAGTQNFFFAADGSFTTTATGSGSSVSLFEATVINTPPATGAGPNIIRVVVSWPVVSSVQGQLPSGSRGHCEFDTALDLIRL